MRISFLTSPATSLRNFRSMIFRGVLPGRNPGTWAGLVRTEVRELLVHPGVDGRPVDGDLDVLFARPGVGDVDLLGEFGQRLGDGGGVPVVVTFMTVVVVAVFVVLVRGFVGHRYGSWVGPAVVAAGTVARVVGRRRPPGGNIIETRGAGKDRGGGFPADARNFSAPGSTKLCDAEGISVESG